MTFREIHNNYTKTLQTLYSTGEVAAITNIIFLKFAGLSKSELAVTGDHIADVATDAALQGSLEKLLKHIPVQYITGEALFYNLKFKVNSQVLIPRPETEELVQEAISFLKTTKGRKVLDIGTGSGCIPISVKKNIPHAEIISIDISGGALQIAAENAAANNVQIDFRIMDFLNEKNHDTFPIFDVIISNPPYIPEEDKSAMDKNVLLHEPHLALFVPQHDPLLFYKKILSFAKQHLAENGKIFLETHEDHAKATAALFNTENYLTEIKEDMQGKERMLVVSRNNFTPLSISATL